MKVRGYCIKRNPQNAEEINSWENKNNKYEVGFIFRENFGYAYCDLKGNTIWFNSAYSKIDGFEETFSVKEFLHYANKLKLDERINKNTKHK